MKYDYSKDIAEAMALVPSLIGTKVLGIRINVVGDEFNILFLNTDQGVFSIHGEMGGEFIGVKQVDEFPEITAENGYLIIDALLFDSFNGKIIHSAREIGTVWNGHGLEFSFKGEFNQTMIIQSIYAGDKPESFEDSLRLGVGEYHYRFAG